SALRTCQKTTIRFVLVRRENGEHSSVLPQSPEASDAPLIEAAKLAPSESPELALTHARELERGNRNRATLAVARKMVCYMLAVERRQQDFVPAEEFSRTIAV